MVDSLVLTPLRFCGSTFTILIPSFSISVRNLPSCPLDTFAEIINSLLFVKMFCSFLCSLFSKYYASQGKSHLAWVFVLKYVSAICYSLCSRSHCFLSH